MAKKKQPRSQQAEVGFQSGHKKFGGRQKGTPNKIPALIKELCMEGVEEKGIWLRKEYLYAVEKEEEAEAAYKQKRTKGRRLKLEAAQAYVHKMLPYAAGTPRQAMHWLLNYETSAYIALMRAMLPLQVTGKVEHDHSRFYETPEEVAERLKELGIPVPPKMIDVTPNKQAA